MKYGYARVSTEEQNLHLQIDALTAAGCSKIFKEKISAAKERPELEKLLSLLQEGDTLVVWKLDRLGRSLRHLIDLVAMFEKKGIKFISLQDSINTSTAQGRLIFNIFASLAEFERDLIRERTRAGLVSARARGRKGGRPAKLSKESELTAIYVQELYNAQQLTIKEICKKADISPRTLYKYVSLDLSHMKEAAVPAGFRKRKGLSAS